MNPAPTDPLAAALRSASSRLAPPPTPLASVVIHAAVLLAWGALFAMAFMQGGLLAWSVGAAYIAYDTVLLLFVAAQSWPLLRSSVAAGARPAAAPARRPTLSVIVAAHDEAAVLPATLAALLAQTDRPDRIVIADDGSTDATADVLVGRYGLVAPPLGGLSADSTLHPGLRWQRLPHGGKAQALNATLLAADTEIVLTVDADTLLDPHAIAAVRQAFAEEPALAGVTGVITPVCVDTRMGRCLEWFQTYEYIRNFLSRRAWMQLDSLLLISGAFAGFRRDAVLAVGGFDPACLVEDYELIHRLRRHAHDRGLAWRFRVLGGAIARTEAPGTLGAFLRQRRRWFGGFLQTQYWYRAMVGNRSYGWLGVLMLPVKAIDTLQPLYGLTAFALLIAYAAWPTARTLEPVGALIGAKILLDLVFHVASVRAYRRWTGADTRATPAGAVLAALVEPFSFQLLRHAGAALGWVSFLTGRKRWGRQTRFGLGVDELEH